MGLCLPKPQAPPVADDGHDSHFLVASDGHLDTDEIVAIIGHGGDTIKAIEAETGAHIKIDRAKGTLSYHGEYRAVEAAKAKIADVVARAHETPDYVGAEGAKKRARALKAGRAAHEAKQRAKECWDKGDKKGAHAESLEGKKRAADAARLHKAAAETIYLHRNGGRPDTSIDLHGLYVNEALGYLQQRLKIMDRGDKLDVITGAGHHSDDHIAKIKPAVVDLLKKKRLRYEELNAGELRVCV